MNKAFRYSFIAFVLLVVAILGAGSVYAGYCFSSLANICPDGYANEAECKVYGGDDAIYAEDKANIPACLDVCCCSLTTSRYYYTIRADCELREQGGEAGSWIESGDFGSCQAYCDGTSACIADCAAKNPIGDSCVGMNGLVSDPGNKYYCSRTGEFFDLKTDCSACNAEPVAVPDCEDDVEITADCMCNDVQFDGVNGGYCCPDGRHQLDLANCLPPNSCNGILNICADACSPDNSAMVTTYNYNDGSPGNPDNCPEDFPYCCDLAAPDYDGCCDQYQVCRNELSFSYSSCNKDDTTNIPCALSCETLYCEEGQKIDSLVNQNPDFDRCYCQDDYYDISDSGSGYCCDDYTDEGVDGAGDPIGRGIYQTGPCVLQAGSISGSVYEEGTSTGIEGAEVSAYRPKGIFVKKMDTAADGGYSFVDLPFDYYTISASKRPGYITNSIDTEELRLNSQDLFNRYIYLSVYEEGVCDSFVPPVPYEFTAESIKGQKAVSLGWSRPNSEGTNCDNVNEYIIRREPEHPLGEIKLDNDTLDFVDHNVSWDVSYTYYIKAHYTTNVISQEVVDDETMGSELCEGIFDDEEFCLDQEYVSGGSAAISSVNKYRYRCDVNIPGEIDNCDAGVCIVKPDNSDKTHCVVISDNCQEQGTFRPFGLYYEQSTCEADWCYYDASDSSIDACDDCNGITCLDYQSRGACERDNCGAGGLDLSREDGDYNDGCSWIDSWGDLGQGYCVDGDFDGARCELCHSSGNLFENNLCNDIVCDGLGDCYSDIETDSCVSCDIDTTCESYDTVAACIGLSGNEQAVDFDDTCGANHAPLNIIGSNDACSLGVCKWGDPDVTGLPGCYKDGDDNDNKDCAGDTDTNNCRSDTDAPVIVPEEDIPQMNASGHYINFSGYDVGSECKSFYFCIDTDNTCCPSEKKSFSDDCEGGVLINPVLEIDTFDLDGVYYIRYYSVDKYNNSEEVKSLEVYMDKADPWVVVTYSAAVQSGSGETLSTVTIDLESKNLYEFITCSYEMLPDSITYNPTIDEFGLGDANKTFRVVFEDMSEGRYTFVTSCEDDVGNVNITRTSILVDAVEEITSVSPVDVKFSSPTGIELSAVTSDPSTCEAVKVSGPVDSNPDTIILSSSASLTHSYTGDFVEGTYDYRIDCVPELGTHSPDSDYIRFTVDTSAPTTTAVNRDIDEVFDFSKWYTNLGGLSLTIGLVCDDGWDLHDQPGVFGCGSSRYCLDFLTDSCSPVDTGGSEVIVDQTSNVYFNYMSVDTGGNVEVINSEVIKIDSIRPSFEGDIVLKYVDPISVITDYFIDGEDLIYYVDQGTLSIFVLGDVRDTLSKVKGVYISINQGVEYEATLLGAVDAQEKSFTSRVFLQDGLNRILVVVKDNAGNKQESEVLVLRDNEGPELSGGVFHGDVKVDNNQVINPGNSKIDGQWGEPVRLSAYITDIAGVKDDANTPLVEISCASGITPSCGGYSGHTDAGALKLVQNPDDSTEYNITLDEVLPLGNYNVTFSAIDNFDNPSEPVHIWFSVVDNSNIVLDLMPDIVDGSLVYESTVKFTGVATVDGGAEAGLEVRAYVCSSDCICGDEAGEIIENPPIYTTSISSISTFQDVLMTDLISRISPPLDGANHVIFEGDWTFYFLDPTINDYYLKFNGDNNYYHIDAAANYFDYGWLTRFTISPPIQGAKTLSHTVSAFNSDKPDGWFSLDIDLPDGEQKCVRIEAERISTRKDKIDRRVTYSTNLFDIDMVSQTVISYADFGSVGNERIVFQVETKKDGQPFDADCVIKHEADDLIGYSFETPMAKQTNTGGGGVLTSVVHSYTIDSSICATSATEGGRYCLIGGTQQNPFNYHHYIVNCTPTDVTMPSKSDNECFKVETYGGASPNIFGENICSGFSGCGDSTVPNDPCVICEDIPVDDDGDDCVSHPECRLCPSGSDAGVGVAGTCLQESCSTCGEWTLSSYSNRECREPQVCTGKSEGACKGIDDCGWCPAGSDATGGVAGECLQGGCSSCGTWTNEIGNECREPVDFGGDFSYTPE